MHAGAAVAAAITGLGATLLMDLWNLFLKRAFGIRSLDFCLLGRWVSYYPQRIFRHASIAATAPRPRECAVGWVAHYTIGVVLAVGFVTVVSSDWLARPTVLPALAYGLVTVAAPFLVLQPSLGLGVAASKTPHPARARLKSVITHLVFGVGLYASALFLQYCTVMSS